MKHSEAQSLYNLYLDYLTRADEIERDDPGEAAWLRDLALEVERDMEHNGYHTADFS